MLSFSSFITPRAGWLAAIAGTVVLLSGIQSPVSAYTDVPTGAYYEDAAATLLELGALDANEPRLRPSDLATRAELVKLLVNLNRKSLLYPTRTSFSDVPLTTWYSPYFETAASIGWIHGDGNCYQSFRPCDARPSSAVNRAEAAALFERAFALEHTGTAPQFPDNPQGQWYYLAIQTARDHCVLQGDGGTGLVRPAAYMNRAEMVVMFNRAYQNQLYGENCGEVVPHISMATAVSSTHVRMAFSETINQIQAENISRYTINTVSGNQSIGIRSVTAVDNYTVDLELAGELSVNTPYVATARNLLSRAGVLFTDSAEFSFVGVLGHITNGVAVTITRVRLTFDTDLDRTRAQDTSRYVVSNVTTNEAIGVHSATLVDSRTVDLELTTIVQSSNSYRVSAQTLLTSLGVAFSDSTGLSFPAATGHITRITAVSSRLLSVTFDTDLESARAAETSRYAVSDNTHALSVTAAQLQSDHRTVELRLSEDMQLQQSYTVNVQALLSAQGVVFSDNGSVVFDSDSVNFTALLTGAQETPSVVSAASGTGAFVLTANGLQYDIWVKNLSGAIISAHFHSGNTGMSGPVLMTIIFSGNHATGTWTGLTSVQRYELLNHGTYVNVHTVAHPDGEIRGQLN